MQARAAAAFASSAHVVLPSLAPASLRSATTVSKSCSSASSLAATQCLSSGNACNGVGQHGRRIVSHSPLFGRLRGGGSTFGGSSSSGGTSSRVSNRTPLHQLHASTSIVSRLLERISKVQQSPFIAHSDILLSFSMISPLADLFQVLKFILSLVSMLRSLVTWKSMGEVFCSMHNLQEYFRRQLRLV